MTYIWKPPAAACWCAGCIPYSLDVTWGKVPLSALASAEALLKALPKEYLCILSLGSRSAVVNGLTQQCLIEWWMESEERFSKHPFLIWWMFPLLYHPLGLFVCKNLSSERSFHLLLVSGNLWRPLVQPFCHSVGRVSSGFLCQMMSSCSDRQRPLC